MADSLKMKRLIASILCLLLSAACSDMCENSVVQELVSPDGKYAATAFIRDCGATTDYSPQVYLRRTGAKARTTGNVFVGDHSSQIEIRWASANELVISSDCKVVRREESYEGITIVFNEKR